MLSGGPGDAAGGGAAPGARPCTFILTYTGVRFDPETATPADIRIEDIAHALAHECRFSGHVSHFYSVAQHCVLVSQKLEAEGYGPGVTLEGLLHDATEAYLKDIPSPLKHGPAFGSGYVAAERRMTALVRERFGLADEEHPAVRAHDLRALETEKRDLRRAGVGDGLAQVADPYSTVIDPWTPRRARRSYLSRFCNLWAALHDATPGMLQCRRCGGWLEPNGQPIVRAVWDDVPCTRCGGWLP